MYCIHYFPFYSNFTDCIQATKNYFNIFSWYLQPILDFNPLLPYVRSSSNVMSFDTVDLSLSTSAAAKNAISLQNDLTSPVLTNNNSTNQLPLPKPLLDTTTSNEPDVISSKSNISGQASNSFIQEKHDSNSDDVPKVCFYMN